MLLSVVAVVVHLVGFIDIDAVFSVFSVIDDAVDHFYDKLKMMRKTQLSTTCISKQF